MYEINDESILISSSGLENELNPGIYALDLNLGVIDKVD